MEMLIVVAVIVILTAIALPTFRNARKRSGEDADIQAVSALYTELQSDYEILGKTYPEGKPVGEPMNESYNSGNARAGELAGLELGNGWTKGQTVFIKSEKVDDEIVYTLY